MVYESNNAPTVLSLVRLYALSNKIKGTDLYTGQPDHLADIAVQRGHLLPEDRNSFIQNLHESSQDFRYNEMQARLGYVNLEGQIYVGQMPSDGIDITTKIPYRLQ